MHDILLAVYKHFTRELHVELIEILLDVYGHFTRGSITDILLAVKQILLENV